jgi:tetratricopeptide (TPR) repeat protein
MHARDSRCVSKSFSGRAYCGRGDVYLAKKDYDKAISEYTKAIKLDPKNVDAYYNRALVYEYKNDYDKAISDYSEVIRLEPNSSAGTEYLGKYEEFANSCVQTQFSIRTGARKLLPLLLFGLLLFGPTLSTTLAQTTTGPLIAQASENRQVWVNTASGIYH